MAVTAMRWLGSLGLALTTALAPSSPGLAAPICPAELAEQLDAAINQAPLNRAHVGVLLQPLAAKAGPPAPLYARHAEQFFTPASNAKLLTTAAALHRFGADYRIRTSVYRSTGPAETVNLRVVGRGDPTITSARLNGLAAQLSDAGITQVNQLVLEDAHFPRFATNPTWEWGDAQWAYAAPVNSLIVNENAVPVHIAPADIGSPLSILWPAGYPAERWVVDNQTTTTASSTDGPRVTFWRTGGSNQIRAIGQLPATAAPLSWELAVLDPAQQFADTLVTALETQGISVARTEITDQNLANPGAEVAALESPPLAELLIPANQESNNLYAEVLLKTLGVQHSAPETTSDASAAGGEAVANTLAELGVDPTAIRLADGSGLSRHNLVTPAALVETLRAMAEHPDGEIFRQSLAVAGVSGTLRNRLQGTPLTDRVQGKSGALTGNVSLSGYLQPPNYEPLVFSLLINHSDQHASVLRDRIDELLLLIAQLSNDC